MKELAIKRHLNEDTRKEGVLINGEVYSLHITEDEVIITDNDDYSKIYSVQSKGMYAETEKQAMADDAVQARRERLAINPPVIDRVKIVPAGKNTSARVVVDWHRTETGFGRWAACIGEDSKPHIDSEGIDYGDSKRLSEAILRELLKSAIIEK